ncbi:MAG TPA: 4-hydroxythreonine-4-phosphate dehydrogenase PdxA, partial [Chloroflexota bacterium]|nr:4-hydroxythreonine-4-phosphate dehydrogenase PdxA [Chloroflexota bacterium]
MNHDERPIIGLTMGDPAGIGPEIIVKAMNEPSLFEQCRPLAIGDLATFQRAIAQLGLSLAANSITRPADGQYHHGLIDVLQATTDDLTSIIPGQVQPAAGKAAAECVIKATQLALTGQIDAIATAPLNKDALNQAGYHYPGHTEMLADLTGTKDFSLTLIAGKLRVIHVTTHVSMRKALDLVEHPRILKIIRLADRFCRYLGIAAPRVAVAGFNCHAGENGLFGNEEIEQIRPAVEEARREGIDASGPWPGDTIFYRASKGEFDIVVAMYHDQGHIPVKMLGFEAGVNTTAGLPIIRTSVDHGTAFDIAGQGKANAGSMLESVKLAANLARERRPV